MESNYEKQVYIARGLFLKYDQQFLIRKFHLDYNEAYLYIYYLSVKYRISRKSGAIEFLEFSEDSGPEHYAECREYTVVMTIYDILCYSRGEEMPELSGQWCPISSFAAAGSSPNAVTFARKYAEQFAGQTEKLAAVCEKIGGKRLPRLAGADLTLQFDAFPFFPVLFQFWDGDEEFAPKIMLLWDKKTLEFMHFETTYYLQGDLLEKIRTVIF